MFTGNDKSVLRSQLRRVLREQYSGGASRVSTALLLRISALERYRQATALVAYLPIGQEPDLTTLLQFWLASGKTLLIPRYLEGEDAYGLTQIKSLTEDTVTGKYGILEPKAELPLAEAVPQPALWLIPGLGFTTSGARLGRGKGYYDRLLQRYPGGWRVGVAWKCQIVPEIATQPWDIAMNQVVTPEAVFSTNPNP